MAILIPDKIRTERTPSGAEITIKEKIIPDSAKATKDVAYYVQKGDPMKPLEKLNGGSGKPKGITIHNTGDIKVAKGTTPAEQYTRATWPNCNMGGAVVHFYVYKGDIWQNLFESERGWHAADSSSRRQSHRAGEQIGGNADTIAIECIGDIPESEDTAAKLAAYLLEKYGLSPDTDLYTHQYFRPTKNCPLYILPRWDEFANRVISYFAASQSRPASRKIKVGDTVNYKGRLYGDSYGGNPGATVSGTYEVTRVIAGRKCGVHLGALGWVPESDCVLVKSGTTEPPKPPTSPPPAPEPEILYRVQVGAFEVKANAERLADELKAKGYPAYITATPLT